MRISYASEEQIHALVDFAAPYINVNSEGYFVTNIPEWYAEVILVLFHPQLMYPKSKISELIRSESRDTVRAVVFLDMTSYSKKLDQVRQLGFNNFVGLMLALWIEANKTSFFAVCYDCPVQLRCYFPRVAMQGSLSQYHGDVDPYAALIRSSLEVSEIDPALCDLLKQRRGNTNNVTSVLSEFGPDTFDVLAETLLPEEKEEGEEEEEEDDSSGSGYSIEAKPATYTLDMYSVPKFGNLSFVIPAVRMRKKSREILRKSGVRTKFFERKDETDSLVVGLSEPTTLSERLHDPQLMALPKELYFKTLLDSDEGIVPVMRGQKKTAIQMSIYVDFSASMLSTTSNCIEVAIATSCALIDCFGPYGEVRVIPFSEEVLTEYTFSSHGAKSSDKWLARLCNNDGGTENVMMGFGGTDIHNALSEDYDHNFMRISREDRACYVVLITDAEDEQTYRIQNMIQQYRRLNVSANTVLIQKKGNHFTSDLALLLQEETEFQQVSYDEFEGYAPRLIQTIAKSYRSRIH